MDSPRPQTKKELRANGATTPPASKRRRIKKGKRFRVAFSFAGEKRDFVSKVAALLADHFGKDAVLYDKFHEAEFSRARLGRYLPKLYHEESELVVVVLCPDYELKEWCGLEWDAIFDLLKKRKEDEVMLTRFHRATVEGLFSDAGFVELDEKSPQETGRLILERIAVNEGRSSKRRQPDDKRVRRAAGTPNNLPRLQYFFGRQADLEKIANAIAEGSRGWEALVDGPGGIGKTSLAIRAAELVPPGRFRRIIFLSSKERELAADGQRSLGGFVLPGYLEMLNAIARELEQPDLAKSSEADRSDQILHALQDDNVLLILDNLETLTELDRNRLFAFLNRLPTRCSAIVTSRRRADASAVVVRLDQLDWPAASDLLSELAKNNERLRQATEKERRELYDETGGNPLLIRWVAGQLGLGHCRDIAAALDFLRSAPSGNDPLEFIFGDLLETFTGNETKVLAALTHFTSAMEAIVISEIAGLNEAAAQGALNHLSRRALVMTDLEERRFILVPMVADFLRRRNPEIVEEIANRLEERAYALILENGYKKFDRFQILEINWPIIASSLGRFMATPNDQLQVVCGALRYFLEFKGIWDEWLLLSRQAERRAVAIDDYLSAGWEAYWIGWIKNLRREADDVLVAADRAAAHWKRADAGARERGFAIRLRGVGLGLKADYPAAITAYRQALDLWRSIAAASEEIAIVLNDLAGIESMSPDKEAAKRTYHEALQVANAVGYTEGTAYITGNLAALAFDEEDWLKAEALAREALTLAKKIGREELIAHTNLRLAKALARQAKKVEALDHAQSAVKIFRKLGSPRLQSALEAVNECEN